MIEHAPAPAEPPRDLQALRRAICARARDFDISALLDLLATMGYRTSDVYFRGHVTHAPQPTLVHHIEFIGADGAIAGPASDPGRALDLGSIVELTAEPARGVHGGTGDLTRRGGAYAARAHPARSPSQVMVTVNLGLLSCRSPLPTYFQQLLRDAAYRDPLLELLQIIDRNLLRARLTCDRPERVIAQWDEITRDLLRIHGLDSLVGLSWLFRHVFPELAVTAQRTSEQLRVPYASARLGFSGLGIACLGATTRIDVHDFEITLRCEDAMMQPGVPWLREVDRRLRTLVFPALDPVCMNLTVVLEIEDADAGAALRDAREPPRESFLGQDALGPPRAAHPGTSPRKVVLYRGILPRNQPDTDQLEGALAAQARATVTAPDAGVADPLAGDPTCEAELLVALGGHEHRYQATVRWGTRAWPVDEPYAIELRCDHLARAAPTARHHPEVWSLLRDHARRALAAALARRRPEGS